MSCGLFAFGTGDATRAAVAGVADPGGVPPAPDATAAPPSTLIGIGSLCSVTYCSFTGSKYENASSGSPCFFSLGESTISKVLVPLRPTSSSCLNLDDGGYLCQLRSSSITGALILSKLLRPEIVFVTVMGSPTCTVLGFASVVIVKFPIAPEKLGGAFGGNGFTSSATGSLLTISFSCLPLSNGSAKNGS